MSRGPAYDAVVGRKMHVNNFIHKFGALGSFLNGKNKPAPEANKTQERAKLLPPQNQLGDMIRCHSKKERRRRNHYHNEAKNSIFLECFFK